MLSPRKLPDLSFGPGTVLVRVRTASIDPADRSLQ
jgi:NADPH:quinone reductase-like Zn-dependent oxidoreductase